MRDEYIELPSPPPPLPPGVTLVSVYPADTPPGAVEMARKVCLACGLTPGRDAALLPVDGPLALVAELRALPAAEGPRFVVAYGLGPGELGAAWAAARYAWIPDGGRAYCFAEAPEVIDADLARKKRLWACLKRVREAAATL